MELNVEEQLVSLSQGVRRALVNTINELEHLFTHDDFKVDVIIKKYDVGYKVKMLLKLSDDLQLRQEIMCSDLYRGIDLAGKKLEVQIRKTRERLKRLEQLNQYHVFSQESDDIPEIENVIRRKMITNEILDEEEAMIKFEMSGHDFFVYRDVNSNLTSVLYQRKDGDYGIIIVD